jgi:hypothetical protein
MECSTNELIAAFCGCRREAGGDRAPVYYSSSSHASVSGATADALALARERQRDEQGEGAGPVASGGSGGERLGLALTRDVRALGLEHSRSRAGEGLDSRASDAKRCERRARCFAPACGERHERTAR